MGGGTDTATDVYAGGGFGSLDTQGEVALYSGADFANSSLIEAYVGWNGGKGRKSVAQAAGIWGTEDVSASLGDTLVRTGSSGEGSEYTIAAAGLPATGSGGLAASEATEMAWVWASVAALSATLVLLSARTLAKRQRV